MSGPMEIRALDLALATSFVLGAGVLSVLMGLGLLRSLAIGTVRTFLQLLALGFVLTWVFEVDSPWVVMGGLGIMVVTATLTLLARVKSRPPGVLGSAFAAIFVSSLTVTFAVTGIVIGVDPWHEARYVLPIAGMILGNSMTGIAIALERLFGDLRSRSDEVWTLLALGASPWEAARTSIRTALTAGLIPMINAMSAVGIVFIPGMMTGQVLAGADPAIAARYQIVVMLMLSAATSIGAILAVTLSYRRAFDGGERLALTST